MRHKPGDRKVREGGEGGGPVAQTREHETPD